MKGLAVLSAYDKTGLEPLAKELVAQGYEILSTGGTAKFLTENGIKVTLIENYTQSPEILDGRVKTLHPKIHGGILARRDNKEDLEQLKQGGIAPIQFVVVSLYPFIQKIREIETGIRSSEESLVEFIDIGGPTMIRAAAKNWRFVVPVCDAEDYGLVAEELHKSGEISKETRLCLAAKVFATMSAYDGTVARYFSLGENVLDEKGCPALLAPYESVVLERKELLRYGENPHQQAGLYKAFGSAREGEHWKQIQGKELSYNNIVDMHAALDLYLELKAQFEGEHPAVIIKHTNPCGAAVRETSLAAFEAARACDPVSAFGGIIALSGVVDKTLAQSVVENFVEVVLVEDLTKEAQEVFLRKKNIRVLRFDLEAAAREACSRGVLIRNLSGDVLLQTRDVSSSRPDSWKVVSEKGITEQELRELGFSWIVCKHVKSNAIVVTKALTAIGVGAGQMSRVDSARIALERARLHGHSVEGSFAASDAFLPFPDTLEVLEASGIKALVEPGGSLKDKEVIDVANKLKVAMVFTGERHFRH